MSKIFWNPDSGEHAVFGPDETPPKHWIDHHPDDEEKAGKSKSSSPKTKVDKKPDDLSGGLTKDEIADALKSGGVEFDASANKAVLTDQLITALKRVLSDRGIAYDENETANALLDKATAPSE